MEVGYGVAVGNNAILHLVVAELVDGDVHRKVNNGVGRLELLRVENLGCRAILEAPNHNLVALEAVDILAKVAVGDSLCATKCALLNLRVVLRQEVANKLLIALVGIGCQNIGGLQGYIVGVVVCGGNGKLNR